MACRGRRVNAELPKALLNDDSTSSHVACCSAAPLGIHVVNEGASVVDFGPTAVARRAPERVAFRAPERSVTYGEFEVRTAALARALRASGVGEDDRVA